MKAIEIMVKEHENINRLNQVIRNACLQMLEGKEVPAEDFACMIDFIRNYADRHHHGKEEQLLFRDMQEQLGPAAEKLIRHGMLVEHDLARLHVAEWEAAVERNDRLDIITYASGYTKLLQRHIDKENQVVYPFAEKNLKPEMLVLLDRRTREFEEHADKEHGPAYYLQILEILETKY